MNITLNNGREVQLVELYQSRTYAGLLLGVPDKDSNRELIERWLEKAAEETQCRRAHLIEPTPILLESDERFRTFYKRTGREVERFPDKVCRACLFSSPIPEAPADCGSMLALLWFQQDFALPIAPEVLEQIKAIDWDECAEGWDP